MWRVVLVLLALLGQIFCSTNPEVAGEPARKVKNILFIMGDDHASYVVGAYGNSIVRTPNIDRLAQEGVRFTNAFTNSPICTPSRQSIITGKYPHAAGVTLLRTPLAEEQVTIADQLKSLGYATGAVGKMHFNSDLKHGFDYRFDEKSFVQHLEQTDYRKPPLHVPVKPVWRPFRDPARIWLNADVLPYPLYDEDSRGTWYVRKAIEFLETSRDKPFCLWVSFNEPHSPFDFPIEYAGKYQPEDMPAPEVSPEDGRWIPAIFRDLTDEDKRGIVASYYTSVEYLDKNVGLVLQALRDLGLDEKTVVVYTSDHGYLLGHHGRFEKHMMWEEAVRVPLIFRNPSLLQAGKVVDALVELVDLVPTLLDVVGVRQIGGLHGKSLVPVLKNETTEHRDLVFSEYYDDNKAMVRTREWKYIFTSGKNDLTLGYATGYGPPGRNQRLYNLNEDPREFHNPAGDPKYQDILKSLQGKMVEVFMTTDPRAPHVPSELSTEEKLEWFLEPPEGQDTQ